MIPLNEVLENVYNFRDKKQISDCQGQCWGERLTMKGQDKGDVGVTQLFCIMSAVMDTQLCAFAETYCSAHQEK